MKKIVNLQMFNNYMKIRINNNSDQKPLIPNFWRIIMRFNQRNMYNNQKNNLIMIKKAMEMTVLYSQEIDYNFQECLILEIL
jgi:hypothetical protein